MTPTTRYAKAQDGISIAYQVIGDGPLDLVYVPGWVSHLEVAWEEPTLARFFEDLASFSRLILFDKRGTGLSDRVSESELPDTRDADERRPVRRATRSVRTARPFSGCPRAGRCASCSARPTRRGRPRSSFSAAMRGGMASPDHPWGFTPETRDEFLATIERDWGGPVGLAVRAPSRIA